MSRPLCISLLLTAALLAPAGLGAAGQEPIDVLREHVAAGIEILRDTQQQTALDASARRDRLCAVTREMFDIYAFSRLVLAGNWERFGAEEQTEFVALFGTWLCRYYITQLQARYSNETVTFRGQEFRSDTRAVVRAEVHWRDLDIPVEVRMVLREGRWKAYDIVIAGISGVMIYRAQFEAELQRGSPAEVLAELRRRIRTQG